MFRKIAITLACAAMCQFAHAAYRDGTYTASGQGNAGPIEVAVTVAGGKISAVKVVKHGETDMLLKAAEKKVAKSIVKNNSTENAKLVSGATNSSNGIIAAVNKALAKAK